MLEGSKVDSLTTRKAASFISSVLRFAIEPMCARSADHSNGIEIQTVPLPYLFRMDQVSLSALIHVFLQLSP